MEDLNKRLAATKKTLPRKVAAIVVDFFKGRFQRQSWIDRTTEKWAPRKGKSKKNKGRAILVRSGRLRRSIRAVNITQEQIIIGTDVPYARIHNEGGKIEGTQNVSSYTRRAHQRKGYTRAGRKIKSTQVKQSTVKSHTRHVSRVMPRRQFMGASEALNKRVKGLITREINKALTGK